MSQPETSTHRISQAHQLQSTTTEMEGLLSLPSELLAMVGRNLIGSVQGTTCGSYWYVINFALICKDIYSVVQHIMFEEIRVICQGEATELRHRRLLPLIRVVEREPTLGTHLKGFELFLRKRGRMEDGEGKVSYLAGVTRHCESFGNFLHAHAPNTEALQIPYPPGCDFLSRSWLNLQRLTVSSIDEALGTYSLGLDINDWLANILLSQGLDVAFLATVLHSPRLTDLSLKATMFKGEAALLDLQPLCIPLQRLTLATHGMQDSTISALLQAPKALIEFQLLSCLQRKDRTYRFIGYGEDPIPRPLLLPRLTTIYEGLRHQTTSLKHLHIHGASFSADGSLNTGHHSFRELSCLQTMEVDVTLLLGWTDCPHSRKPSNEDTTLDPRALGALLPDNLQGLVLYDDSDYLDQRGVGYMYEIVLGIIDEADRLTCLKTLTLAADYIHCWSCAQEKGIWFDEDVEEQELDAIAECDAMKRLADNKVINLKVSGNVRNYDFEALSRT